MVLEGEGEVVDEGGEAVVLVVDPGEVLDVVGAGAVVVDVSGALVGGLSPGAGSSKGTAARLPPIT